jgi:hypothetical protein
VHTVSKSEFIKCIPINLIVGTINSGYHSSFISDTFEWLIILMIFLCSESTLNTISLNLNLASYLGITCNYFAIICGAYITLRVPGFLQVN